MFESNTEKSRKGNGGYSDDKNFDPFVVITASMVVLPGMN